MINKIKSILQELAPIKRYAIFCTVVFVVFIVSGMAGCKLTGDDNDSKDDAPAGSRSHSGSSRFYHK